MGNDNAGARPPRDLPPVTADLVRDALSFISADCGHDERARLAGSIYSELGEGGKDAWMDWAGSRSAPSLQEDRDTWKSAKRFTRIKIGTLFGRAKDSGFRFPAVDQAAPKPDAALLAAERAKREAKAAAAEAEYRARADQAARDARAMWADAVPATFEAAGYLLRKGVSPHGVRMLDDGTLLVPMIDIEGMLQNLQRIAPRKPEGDKPEKRFLPGGRKSGLFHLVGAELAEVEGLDVLLAAEGYATAASLYEATGRPVLVCIDAGNLVNVIKLARERWPALPLLVCADDDRETEARSGKNPGKLAAMSCVRAADTDTAPCGMVLPAGLPEGAGTDFNDLMLSVSREAVAEVVGAAVDGLLDAGGVELDQAGAEEPPPWMDEAPAPAAGLRLAVDNTAPAPTTEGEGKGAKGSRGRKAKGGEADDEEAKRRAREREERLLERVDSMSERYTLIYGTESAWDAQESMLIKIAAMRLASGKDAVNIWLARPSRRMVNLRDLVFEPGVDVPAHQVNMFDGLEMESKKAGPDDVRPMLDLLNHLCLTSASNADEVDNIVHWILCWLALPLQRIGTKMASALIIHGPQGTGKNLFFDAWRDIYGKYGKTVGQTEVEDKFNEWISGKLAFIANEVVSRQEMYHRKDALKMLVTESKDFPIRGMHTPTRWERNAANIVFLSNQRIPLALDDGDRRHMVVYTPQAADDELYGRVVKFLAADGLAKWLYYLQHYDVGDFKANTKPPMTRDKQRLIQASWKAPARFAYEWTEGFLDLPVRVCSGDQLYRAFQRWCTRSGERFPPNRDVFTEEVNRWAQDTAEKDLVTGKRQMPVLRCKTVQHKDPENPNAARKSIRTWLLTCSEPPEGVSEGKWAFESARLFQSDLDRFERSLGFGEQSE